MGNTVSAQLHRPLLISNTNKNLSPHKIFIKTIWGGQVHPPKHETSEKNFEAITFCQSPFLANFSWTNVPMVMLFLTRILLGTPVIHFSPPPWCPEVVGAVLGDPGDDRAGMDSDFVLSSIAYLGRRKPGGAHSSPDWFFCWVYSPHGTGSTGLHGYQ